MSGVCGIIPVFYNGISVNQERSEEMGLCVLYSSMDLNYFRVV